MFLKDGKMFLKDGNEIFILQKENRTEGWKENLPEGWK